MKGYCFSLFLVFSLLVGCNKVDVTQPEAAAVSELNLVELNDEVVPTAQLRMSADAAAVGEQTPTAAQQSPVTASKKIIRSGHIAIESKTIKKSKQALDALLTRYDGYYEQETLSSSGNYANYSLVARIPAERLDQFLKDLENGGDKLTERSLRSEDVSLQYVDSESRLKSKRAYLERYQQLLGQAKNVKDVLEIQEQIRQLQEDIDSQESIMRRLKDQLAFSSLSIQLFEYQANLPIGSQSFWIQLKEAFTDGWALLGDAAVFILRLWPFFLVFFGCYLLWRRFKRK